MTAFRYGLISHLLSNLQPDLLQSVLLSFLPDEREPDANEIKSFPHRLVSHSFAMKFLIVLSTLLVIPIIMKFQVVTFQKRSHPKLLARVSAVLESENVTDPQVTLQYHDVAIAGYVESEESARQIARKIEDIRPLRLVANELSIAGWFEITRQQSGLVVQGLMAAPWQKEVLKGVPAADLTQLRHREKVALPGKNAASWGILLDQVFEGFANRTLRFRDNELTFSGPVTAQNAIAIRERVDALGLSNNYQDQSQRYPSVFHFPQRKVSSPIEGEPLRSLALRLTNLNLAFEPGTVTLSEQGQQALEELQLLVVETSPLIHFVLGAHPNQDQPELTEQRAGFVREELLRAGVAAERLRLTPFGMTEDNSEIAGQVELLVW